jgi:hypothetical protein
MATATAATASHPASASTSGRDVLAAASSSPAAVCLVPFRFVVLPPLAFFPASPDLVVAAAMSELPPDLGALDSATDFTTM